MGGECPCPSTGTPWAASRTASTVTWWVLPDVVVRVIAPFTTIPLAWLWVHSLLPRDSADMQRIAVCSTPSSGRTPSPLRSRGAAHITPDKEILLPGERRVLHSLRRACRASASVANQSVLRSSSVCHTVSCSATSRISIERIRDCCRKEQLEALCRLTKRGACGAADRADTLL
ncbi:hypothetical protein WA556_006280 [Blastocystis sp. ATCC 50177/Nand II]